MYTVWVLLGMQRCSLSFWCQALYFFSRRTCNWKRSVACCMDFLWALGKQARGLIWKQGEDESWRLPTSPHPPSLIVCIKIGVAPFYHHHHHPPSPCPLPHLHLFFKCWLNTAIAQLEKMKKKKGWKGWPFVLRSFVRLTHPPTASRGSTSSL